MDRLSIIYSDERVVVVNKPAGLLSVPPPKGNRDGSAHVQSILLRSGVEAAPVHRIDMETSGLLLCARDTATREALMALFKGRGITKRYLAVVQGNPRQETGVWKFSIKDCGAHAMVSTDGQSAETRWKIIERAGPVVLMELDLVTGRHNQARIHAAHAGMPIAGESKYALRREARIKHKRCALHAASIDLTFPWETTARHFEAALPTDMRNLLEKARTGRR
jgi:RluA family pseudouridine synthase